MSHAKQILVQHSPKKGSVRFDALFKDKHPLFSSLYLMRDAVARSLGIKNLDDVHEIEVSVKVVGNGKVVEDDD
jgi:hypothetical protein